MRYREEFDAIDCDREVARAPRGAAVGGVLWRDQQTTRFCYYTWDQFIAMAPNILDAEAVRDVEQSHRVAVEHGGDAYVFCWLVPGPPALKIPFFGSVFRSVCVSWVYVRPRRRSERLSTAMPKRQRSDGSP